MKVTLKLMKQKYHDLNDIFVYSVVRFLEFAVCHNRFM